MSARRKRRYARVKLSPEMLLREIGHVRSVVRRAGVRPEDREDAVQQILLVALELLASGVYRPDPKLSPRVAVQRWFLRLAYFQALKAKEPRRERAAGLVLVEEAADPEPRHEAREIVARLRDVGAEEREMLIAYGDGATLEELAGQFRTSMSSLFRRLNLARARLFDMSRAA